MSDKLSKKDAEAFCQLMERHGYFTSRLGDDGKRYYSRTSKWPPPDDFEPDDQWRWRNDSSESA